MNSDNVLFLAQHYGQPATRAMGDLDDDGIVDLDDLLRLAQQYDQTYEAASRAANALKILNPALDREKRSAPRPPGLD